MTGGALFLQGAGRLSVAEATQGMFDKMVPCICRLAMILKFFTV